MESPIRPINTTVYRGYTINQWEGGWMIETDLLELASLTFEALWEATWAIDELYEEHSK